MWQKIETLRQGMMEPIWGMIFPVGYASSNNLPPWYMGHELGPFRWFFLCANSMSPIYIYESELGSFWRRFTLLATICGDVASGVATGYNFPSRSWTELRLPNSAWRKHRYPQPGRQSEILTVTFNDVFPLWLDIVVLPEGNENEQSKSKRTAS